jgi:acetyl-CoA C-acetyltransferase
MLLEDPWSYYAGATPETNHELMLRAYIKKYNISGENLEVLMTALAEVSVKNHTHALQNEYAQFQRRITVEQVLNARKAARKPLGIFDFAPISDGASALIVTSGERAAKLTDTPVYVLGCSSATDFLNFPSRDDLTHFIATKIAMKNALKAASLSPWDLQILELYDQSTVMEMISLEDLGFCREGTAWKSIHESCQNYKGYYAIDGQQLFTNLNGGLKADGNPIGATGGAQVFEIFKQLRGEAGDRQVKVDGLPKNGASLELEGFGTNGHVSILGRE